MVDKGIMEFVEQVVREIENLYPEELKEVICKKTTSYGGELFNDKLFITWSVEDVKETRPNIKLFQYNYIFNLFMK